MGVLVKRGEKIAKEKKNSSKKSGAAEAAGTTRRRKGKKPLNLALQTPL